MKFGAVISYLIIGISILIGLLYTPWMIRSIGQANYGLYTLAISLISLFTIDFGMSAATSRFISKYNAQGDSGSVNNLLGLVYKLYITISALLFVALIVVYFFLDYFYVNLTTKELSIFKVIYLIVASYSVISFPFITLNGILTAYEKFISLKLCDLVQKLSTAILVATALFLGMGIYSLVALNAITGLITILLKLSIIKKNTPIKVNFKFRSRNVLKEIMAFSIWTTVISVCQRLTLNITPSILGIVSGSVSIAIFAPAAALEAYVYTIASALGGLFLPRVSRMLRQEEDNSGILSLMVKVGRLQLIIVGLLFIGFLTVGDEFIDSWLGAEFQITYYCALLLIFPTILQSPKQIADTTIIAANKVKQKSIAFIIMGGTSIVLSFILSYFWDELGAALAVCIAYIIRTVFLDYIYYKYLNLNMLEFYKQTYLPFMPAMFLSLVFGISLNLIIPIDGWLGFFLKGVSVVIFYSTIIWFIVLNSFEKNLFRNISKKISTK